MADAAACPVAALAREARLVTAALHRNEEAQVGRQPHARIPLEQENKLLEDCRTVIEDDASLRPATSAEGVLFQVALVLDAANVLESYGQEGFSRQNEAQMRRIGRLVHSIAAFVERGAGLRREEVFGDWYLSRELDPHATVEKALAEAA